MPYIKHITLDTGSTYDLVDQGARDMMAELLNYTSYLGVTTTALEEGDSTNPVMILNQPVTAVEGDIVTYEHKEFIFNKLGRWQYFADLSALGKLAYKDRAEGSYTPVGIVSKPTFAGDELSSTGKFTPDGNVVITTGSGAANYTPAGDVSKPTFLGDELTSTGTYTPAGDVTITKAASGEANYTPEGVVSAPEITVTPTTGSISTVTDVGTLPVFSATVQNENLVLSFNPGTLPTMGDSSTVVLGIDSAVATAPTFTGTGARLEGSFSGTQGSVSVKGTPSGDISKPTFTGTGVDLEAGFTGTEGNVSVKGTPTGDVSQPTFTGTQATIEVE